MTSIHTNTSAMVALATLSEVNKNLAMTNEQIATGKTVNTSADDAGIWAVATIMEADVAGFQAVADALNLGAATVTVARSASEKVTDLLEEMKTKIVTAQGENVDRESIQADIDELKGQIEGIVSAAQFNGLNLIDGSEADGINVVSSLDRSQTGVTTASISVAAQNLSSGNAVAGTGTEITTITAVDSSTNATTNAANNDTYGFAAGGTNTGDSVFELFVDGASVGTSVTVAAGTTSQTAGAEVYSYLQGLNREDISFTMAADVITVESEIMFDTVNVELRATNVGGFTGLVGMNADTALNPGISSESTTANDEGDGIQLTVGGTIAAGDDFNVIIDGVTILWDSLSSTPTPTTLAEAANELADTLNIAIAGNATLNGRFVADVAGAVVTIDSLTGERADYSVEVAGGSAATGTTTLEVAEADAAAGTYASQGTLIAGTGVIGSSISGSMEGIGTDIEFGGYTIAEGDSYTVHLREGLNGETKSFTYVASNVDTVETVAQGLEALIDASGDFDIYTEAFTDSAGVQHLRIAQQGSETLFVALEAAEDGAGSGGLGKLAGIDVTTNSSAAQALDDIEDLIQTAIDAAAAFGSSQKRIEIQQEFITQLIDLVNTGIGGMVDTNMEAASAALQALQTQQQLATQALSIANAGPQSILLLFQ